MNRPTIKIELSNGNEAFIREWITGREQEYTEEPLFQATSFGGRANSKAEDVSLDIRADKAVHENNHREIEVFVESIKIGEEILKQEDGKEKILKAVLDRLPSNDYEKILSSIREVREKSKKK